MTLVCLLACAAGAWVFARLANEVQGGSTRSLDESILIALRDPADLSDPLGPPWFEEMMRDATALGGVTVLAGIVIGVGGYLVLSQHGRLALLLVAAMGGAVLLSLFMKFGFDRPRPMLVPHGSHVYTRSFPSGHSMLAATTYLTLAAILVRIQTRRRLRVFLLAIAIFVTGLVGVSRVYLGVHWPTDVLAGWMVGTVWALLCWLVTVWVQRGKSRPDPV